jgi:signal transduction histidine kinase
LSADLAQRRLERERRARREAEQLLEEKSLELFSRNEELQRLASLLDTKRQELQDALDREKEINGLQRQFVSMVSHEFRTPLAIIDGNARRILKRPVEGMTGRETGALQKIRNAVLRLTELMESVLSAARVDDGRIAFDPAACSPGAIIQDLAESYAEIYPDHRITLDLARLPDEIIADQKLLRQVFSNLLSNAVKYSQQGSDVRVDGRTDDERRVVIAVHDQGVGIPEAEQAKLFQRFFRASTSVGITGSGIGLHLAAHLVHLHGGSIELESREGEGSTFRVVLPIEPAGTRDAPCATEIPA